MSSEQFSGSMSDEELVKHLLENKEVYIALVTPQGTVRTAEGLSATGTELGNWAKQLNNPNRSDLDKGYAKFIFGYMEYLGTLCARETKTSESLETSERQSNFFKKQQKILEEVSERLVAFQTVRESIHKAYEGKQDQTSKNAYRLALETINENISGLEYDIGFINAVLNTRLTIVRHLKILERQLKNLSRNISDNKHPIEQLHTAEKELTEALQLTEEIASLNEVRHAHFIKGYDLLNKGTASIKDPKTKPEFNELSKKISEDRKKMEIVYNQLKKLMLSRDWKKMFPPRIYEVNPKIAFHNAINMLIPRKLSTHKPAESIKNEYRVSAMLEFLNLFPNIAYFFKKNAYSMKLIQGKYREYLNSIERAQPITEIQRRKNKAKALADLLASIKKEINTKKEEAKTLKDDKKIFELNYKITSLETKRRRIQSEMVQAALDVEKEKEKAELEVKPKSEPVKFSEAPSKVIQNTDSEHKATKQFLIEVQQYNKDDLNEKDKKQLEMFIKQKLHIPERARIISISKSDNRMEYELDGKNNQADIEKLYESILKTEQDKYRP